MNVETLMNGDAMNRVSTSSILQRARQESGMFADKHL